MTKNGENWNYLNFCSFSFFSGLKTSFLDYYGACLLFCEHLDILLAEKNFLHLCAFVILKFINFFQFFSQSCL